jgi:dTDP-4-amino-4,6-dideoxygalactose transaminase
MSLAHFIPFNRPSISDAEIDEVVATLRSGWLTTGPRTAQFERELRDYVGAGYALAVNSCTAGLHLALAALGVGAGDEVITTPLTFCATVNTILQVGAQPVLADVDRDGNIDPGSIERRITGRTRAILPVHLGGLPCRMEEIWRLASRLGLFVIEDAAHAIGSHYHGVPVGGGLPAAGLRSDAVAFSFYATKNLTTGEGGMVTTHSEDLLERMRVFCLHGIDKDAWNRYAEAGNWYYEVKEIGFKYNLSDLQAAVGIHQLRRQEEFIARRTQVAGYFHEQFQPLEEVEIPASYADCRHSWHLYVLRLKLEKLRLSRNEFMAKLRELGIGTSVHFIPIPMHPAYREWSGRQENHCPRAMELYPRLVSLPLYPAMSDAEVERVAAAVRQVVREHTNDA